VKKKVYEPLPMITNGHYAVLYGKPPATVQGDAVKLEHIPSDSGCFMTKGEAIWMALSGIGNPCGTVIKHPRHRSDLLALYFPMQNI